MTQAVRPRRWSIAGLLVVATLGGCVMPARVAPGPPFHLAAVAAHGDATRRASTRLLLEGLDRDALGEPGAALASYERALELDPTNPWAYLALARHHAEGTRPQRALPYLDKTETLLARGGTRPPGVEAHLHGLRGQVLTGLGRREQAAPLLAEARRLAPRAWSDGRLDARELR